MYGVNLTFYERVVDPKIISTIQVLEQMYRQQQLCQLSPPRMRSAEEQKQSQRLSLDSNVRVKPVDASTTDLLYAPKSIALVSRVPAVASLEAYLRQLFTVSIRGDCNLVTKYIHNLLSQVPMPKPGWTVEFGITDGIRAYQPGRNSLPMFQYSFQRLFALFSPATLLQLFTCVILEQQILLVSEDYELLMLVAESLNILLYPFSWQHAYVPILPANMLHFLEAPVPFIMGLQSSLPELDEATQQVCVSHVLC